MFVVPGDVLAVVTGTVHNGDNEILEAGDTVECQTNVFNTGNTCLEDVVVTNLVLGGENECVAHDKGIATNRFSGI